MYHSVLFRNFSVSTLMTQLYNSCPWTTININNCTDTMWKEKASSIMSILAAHLANQRVNWRQLLSQTELEWWATGTSGSPSRWQPWSAEKPPGSPAPRFPDSSHHCQVLARSWRPPSVLPHGLADNLRKIDA